MQFKIKTSLKTANTLKDLQARTKLTPNVLARLAISLSLRDPTPVNDLELDNQVGLEFNRQTLTGSYDAMYKVLVAQHAGKALTDEEFFPEYIKKHMDRGASKLKNEYDYAGNVEKFLINLATLDKTI